MLEERLLDEWEGMLGSSAGHFHSQTQSTVSDYHRACEVSDDLGLIPVGYGNALVLGEEPLPTTWIARVPGSAAAVVRSYYNEFDPAISQLIQQIPAEIFSDPGEITISVDSPLVLFDSAEPGANVRGNRLRFELPQGRYRIDPADHRPVPAVRFWIYRFVRTA